MSVEDWIFVLVFALIFGETAAIISKKIRQKKD